MSAANKANNQNIKLIEKETMDDQYTLIHGVDEERGLLQSTNEFVEQDRTISRASSVCDQSIDMSSSSLDEAAPLYKELPNSSSVLVTKEKKVQQKKNTIKRLIITKLSKGSNSEDQQNSKKDEDNSFKGKLKEYTDKFVNLFRWKREYNSFNSLYLQMAFDSLAIVYTAKKVQQLQQKRVQSYKDERLVRECINSLAASPFLFFNKASTEQKVVAKGYLLSYPAITHLNNSKPSEKKSYKGFKENFKLFANANSSITCTYDDDLVYEKQSVVQNKENKMNFFSKMSASMVSLFSGYVFKSKVSFNHEDIRPGQVLYFFGKKINFNGNSEFQIQKVFKEFDIKKFRIDQGAYLLSMLIASGLGLYFSIKLVKNILYYIEKKKLYSSKQKKQE